MLEQTCILFSPIIYYSKLLYHVDSMYKNSFSNSIKAKAFYVCTVKLWQYFFCFSTTIQNCVQQNVLQRPSRKPIRSCDKTFTNNYFTSRMASHFFTATNCIVICRVSCTYNRFVEILCRLYDLHRSFKMLRDPKALPGLNNKDYTFCLHSRKGLNKSNANSSAPISLRWWCVLVTSCEMSYRLKLCVVHLECCSLNVFFVSWGVIKLKIHNQALP